ncbi:MAG: glycosyltransferase family 2 protein [Zhenhengia sp.]|uniref:glycosyltransferase family 2 protein n=1 Tax=Zhenhengia sp. TaxID=2944208 RepID=UPI0039927C05
MSKISIIVPIYNAQEYLDKCIDSLISQTMKNIEIILINDGSKDNSLEICKRYEKTDQRIKVINKINGGVSSTRNLGLKIANGEYILFVDSDDYLEVDACEELYKNIIQKDSDLLIYNYIKHTNKDAVYIDNLIEKDELKKEEIIEELVLNLIGGEEIGKTHILSSFRSPWIYMYKKSILTKYNICFDESLIIGEDFIFNILYMLNIEKLAVSKGYFYHYCINDESATNIYKENYWDIHKKILIKLKEILAKNYIREDIRIKLKKRINALAFSYMIGIIRNENSIKNTNRYKNKIKKIRVIYSKDEIIKEYFTIDEMDFFSISNKIKFIMLKLKMFNLLYLIYKIFKR